jgi:hypothetical protein
VKLGSRVTWTDTEGVVVEMAVINEYEGVVLPQLHIKRDGTVRYRAADAESSRRLVAYMDHQVGEQSLGAIRTLQDPSADAAALVLRGSDDAYIRLPSLADRDWFLQLLQAIWNTELRPKIKSATDQKSAAPQLHVHFVYRPNDVYRAVAKTAFNTLTIARGTALVLRPEFDPLREYIRGDLQLPTTTSPDQIAIDERFVRAIPPDRQTFGFGPAHTIIFAYEPPRLLSFVTLYGNHQFLVQFPHIEYDEQEFMFGHEFTVDRTSNRALEKIDVFRLLLQARPNLLGANTKKALDVLSGLGPES